MSRLTDDDASVFRSHRLIQVSAVHQAFALFWGLRVENESTNCSASFISVLLTLMPSPFVVIKHSVSSEPNLAEEPLNLLAS